MQRVTYDIHAIELSPDVARTLNLRVGLPDALDETAGAHRPMQEPAAAWV